MTSSTIPTVTLNNGVEIPQLGFGVFQIPEDETTAAVSAALETGYRHIDTAAIYGNEAGVGRALADSGLSRDELFITTKVWNSDQGYDATLRAFDTSLTALGLDRLDLYLIHWPTPARDVYADTWRALERLVEEGRLRAAGVSKTEIRALAILRLGGDGNRTVAVEFPRWPSTGTGPFGASDRQGIRTIRPRRPPSASFTWAAAARSSG
ncbi:MULTISPECIES: aldo/keto reductase [Rhodococcus]|uniref:aldo/keto reductase n=1 Tax=Rhodococcus sp. Q1 TaxID=2508718 RepID=UPI0020CF0973|nr:MULTISPECIES: aldo/keto reductase [Rhodococcus]